MIKVYSSQVPRPGQVFRHAIAATRGFGLIVSTAIDFELVTRTRQYWTVYMLYSQPFMPTRFYTTTYVWSTAERRGYFHEGGTAIDALDWEALP